MFVSYLLQSEVKAVSAMIQGVINFRTKMDIAMAGIKAHYSGEELDIASAVIMVLGQSAEKRNKIAHSIFATCDELEDATLLIELEADSQRSIKWMIEDTSETSIIEQTVPDRKQIWVYKKKDFEDIIKLQQSAASSLTLLLHYLKNYHGNKDQMRQLLSLEQPTMTALSQIQAGRVKPSGS